MSVMQLVEQHIILIRMFFYKNYNYIQNLHKLILTDFNQSDEQVINPMYKVRQKQNK